MDIFNYYKEYLILRSVYGLLQWDSETMLASGLAENRATQMAYISKIMHQKITDPRFVESVNNFNSKSELDSLEIEKLKKTINLNLALDETLVAQITEATSKGFHLWNEAKKANNFSIVQHQLDEIINLKIEQAQRFQELKCFKDYSLYDVMLDLYEPEFKSEDLINHLKNLVDETQKMLPEILEKTKNYQVFKVPMKNCQQKKLNAKVAACLGLNPSISRQDTAPHPFSIDMGKDIRITTRFDQEDALYSLYSILHETGHALYSQNISEELLWRISGNGASMGVHESQSRFYENIIGRSRSFSKYLAGIINVDSEKIYQSVNQVGKSFIRTESDEVTYNLHIWLRLQIEKDFILGKLKAKDLKDRWNNDFEKLFGLKVENDSEGCLQDNHWYHGDIGYFPTYSIGNLMSAQLFNDYKKINSNWSSEWEMGNFSNVGSFLKDKVHSHGAKYNSPKTISRALNNQKLDGKYFIDYIKNKYLA